MAQAGRKGILFALPWIIGLSVFTVYPFCMSLYYSFTDYSVLLPPKWVGLQNFQEMIGDVIFWKVLANTFIYAVLAISFGVVLSLTLSLVMNAIRRGQVLYSVIYYLPQLLPSVVVGILSMWIFNAQFGLLNNMVAPILKVINPKLEPPAWLIQREWALPAIVAAALWAGVGQTAFIYLAKLQDVSQELYEAAEIDGASTLEKIRHVTIPTISPLIFFNVIMGIIGAFQVFDLPYVITQGEGGPDRATTFLPHYIYESAFRNLRMGYACALSWFLFVVILALTVCLFRLSRDRVHYAGK